MPEESRPPPAKSIHGHIGPATAAEKAAKEADPAVVSQSEKAAIAEAAAREEDA